MERNFGETTLGEILLYGKEHLSELVRRWYLVILGGLIFGGLGFTYCFITGPKYVAYASFTVDTESAGASSMISSAMEIAGNLGLTTGGSADQGLTIEYLLGVCQSNRTIKTALLKEEVIDGNSDVLANHYMKMYEWEEDDVVPDGFTFTTQHIDSVSPLEDSVLTLLFEEVVDDHLVAEMPEGLNMDVILIESKSKAFSILFAENILDATENFFIENRIRQDKETVRVMQARADSVKQQLLGAEYALAVWQDSRNRLVKAKASLEEIELRRQVEMYNVKNAQVLANLESARFNLLQNTPVMSIIDEPRFSLYVEEIETWLGTLVGVIVGLFFGVLGVVTLKVGRDAVNAERNKMAA